MPHSIDILLILVYHVLLSSKKPNKHLFKDIWQTKLSEEKGIGINNNY